MFDALQNIWFFASGIAAGLTALLHMFAGGPEIAGPLLRSKDIHDVPKYVNYYCWHLLSMTLVAMSAGVNWSAFDSTQNGLAWMWTVMAVAFCLWSVSLVAWKRQSTLYMPQWSLFGVILACAIAGHLT